MLIKADAAPGATDEEYKTTPLVWAKPGSNGWAGKIAAP